MSFRLYQELTKRFDYRILTWVPPLITVLMLAFTLIHGLQYGIDFEGGTWIDILTDRKLSSDDTARLESDLSSVGLKDVKVRVGYDIDSGKDKVIIQTTTVVQDSGPSKGKIIPYTGELTEYDTATIALSSKPPVEFKDALENRIRQKVDMNYSDGTLTIEGMDLNEAELSSYLTYHFKENLSVNLAKKNFNMRSVGPTLGRSFREQGFKAIVVALLFMGIVVYIAFRTAIPTVAVIQAAVCDVSIALGGMSLFGIPMEPASLGALLMLIGYSVDTDILLTARVLKNKAEDFYVLVDDAMKTGITMTLTTMTVMTIVYVISTTLTQITTLSSIASVLLIGLFADIFATWITNVGILKWYIESPGYSLKRLFGGRR